MREPPFFIALFLAFFFGSAQATPILSADGSLLQNVEVEGLLYEVMFGDGVLGDFYTLEKVEAPEWFKFSESLGEAIVVGLNSARTSLSGPDINGCEPNAGFLGLFPNGCLLLLPKTARVFPPDLGGVAYYSDFTPLVPGSDVRAEYLSTGGLGLGIEYDSKLVDWSTIVSFRIMPYAVSIPPSIALICLGLVGIGLNRQANQP